MREKRERGRWRLIQRDSEGDGGMVNILPSTVRVKGRFTFRLRKPNRIKSVESVC